VEPREIIIGEGLLVYLTLSSATFMVAGNTGGKIEITILNQKFIVIKLFVIKVKQKYQNYFTKEL
jgi:hypothetical protein